MNIWERKVHGVNSLFSACISHFSIHLHKKISFKGKSIYQFETLWLMKKKRSKWPLPFGHNETKLPITGQVVSWLLLMISPCKWRTGLLYYLWLLHAVVTYICEGLMECTMQWCFSTDAKDCMENLLCKQQVISSLSFSLLALLPSLILIPLPTSLSGIGCMKKHIA